MVDKLFDKFEKENPGFPKYVLEEAKKYLPNKVSDKDVSKVLNNIKNEYEESLVTPYEAIGIIAAQSVGAEATQMTLNTFHFAGVASHGVEGLPRLIEILDGKKNLSAPLMKLYLKKGLDEVKLKLVADKIKETRLIDFANNVDIDLEGKVVKVDLDVSKFKKLKVELDSIVSYLDKKIKKSAEIVGKQLIISGTSSSSLKDMMAIKELALNSVVYGIKGIKDVSLIKEDDEYVIITRGIALGQVQNFDEIDKSRIYSNDFFGVLENYGVEAARQVIITEIQDVVKSQGLSINDRHVLLIADAMTYTGDVKGMTRYGIVSDKQNVLTRASFETPLKHLAKGALQNEENKLNTITENVMTNQMVRVGTGIPRISVKENK
ncbi:MAG: hypothetical protein PF569_07025 [Candidatus Woesearchaeota archaeon]|jgi:DNA-directed RNA polymerase subunit A"|nr:hypothetical protein [Candidatus Woesearchaeota archaeon]